MAYPETMATVEERFWAKVNKSDTCWLWMAGISSNGYGVFSVDHRTSRSPHRYAFELLVGPIPEGMHLDHLCRNRACCNPAHLEIVTPRQNVMRSPIAPAAINAAKTHCIHGHEFTPENIVSQARPSGGRACKTCMARRNREYKARKKADRTR